MDRLQPVLDAVSQAFASPNAAAWAQAIATTLAIIVTIWLTFRVRSTRRREMRQAARSICDRSVSVLHGLMLKEAATAFSAGNIDASQDEVEAAIQILKALPVHELSPREIEPFLLVQRHMVTARRRLRFIRERLSEGKGISGVGQFETLLRSVEAAAGALGRSRASHRR